MAATAVVAWEAHPMGFGQQSGPPSSAKQVAEIADLLEQAGFASLREARHPYGLSQRQANGKFTRGEADELIGRLQAELESVGRGDAAEPPAVTRPTPAAAASPATAGRGARREADRQAEAVAVLSDEVLADELVRRGWMCMPPA